MEQFQLEKIKPVKRSTKRHGFGTERRLEDLQTNNYGQFVDLVREAYVDSMNLGRFEGILIQGIEGALTPIDKGTKLQGSYSLVFEEEIYNPEIFNRQYFTTRLHDTYEQDSDDKETSKEYLDELLDTLSETLKQIIPDAIVQRDSNYVAVLNPNPERGLPLGDKVKRALKKHNL